MTAAGPCPNCGIITCQAHCKSPTCDLVRCTICQAYGTLDGHLWRLDHTKDDAE